VCGGILLRWRVLIHICERFAACPEGFFYAGEPSVLPPNRKEERWEIWDKGPTSPVYSCYAFLEVGYLLRHVFVHVL
jgi:hypothetical protein